MIGERETEVGLTAEQAFEIALEASERKIFTQASAWLIAVFEMIQNSETSLDQGKVIDAMSRLAREVFRLSVMYYMRKL